MKYINVCCSQELFEVITKLASRKGLTKSETVVWLIKTAAENQKLLIELTEKLAELKEIANVTIRKPSNIQMTMTKEESENDAANLLMEG